MRLPRRSIRWWAAWCLPILLAAWGGWQIGQTPDDMSFDVPATGTPAITSEPVPVHVVQSPVVPRSEPVRIGIRAVWINALIDPIGLDRNGVIETPSYARPNNAAWYRLGPTPGEPGAAVLYGHIDSKTSRAVFFELRRIKRGARIEITRKDGTTVIFTVVSVEQHAKAAFPTQRVYRSGSMPALRLITCGGKFNRTANRYPDNIIVFATFTSIRAAKSRKR